MFHQDKYTTVAFCAGEFNYWIQGSTVPAVILRDGERFFPRLLCLESRWETHSILLAPPVGIPMLASRKSDWIDIINKGLRETLFDLRAENPMHSAAREKWAALVGAAATPLSPATGLFLFPTVASLYVLPLFSVISWQWRPPLTAAQQVEFDARHAPHLTVMRSALAPHPQRRALLQATRLQLPAAAIQPTHTSASNADESPSSLAPAPIPVPAAAMPAPPAQTPNTVPTPTLMPLPIRSRPGNLRPASQPRTRE
jgi:hypothetical protein